MRKEQIDRFFNILSQELDCHLTIILTGAAAGCLMGSVRPSVDIDFAIKTKTKSPRLWRIVDLAVKKTVEQTGIEAEYAEDIDRWGMISLLDYHKHARLYKKFKSLNVLLMDPVYWSIGKMTRYLDSDIQDIKSVFQKKKVPVSRAIKLWAQAVKKSPRSAAQGLFVTHVKHFLRSFGRITWGRSLDVKKSIQQFEKHAR